MQLAHRLQHQGRLQFAVGATARFDNAPPLECSWRGTLECVDRFVRIEIMEDIMPTQNRGTAKRGFASMDPEKQRQIASKGGKASHARGTAHEFTSEEASRAGRKAHAQGNAHEWTSEEAREAGRKGGMASGSNRAARRAQAQGNQGQSQGGASGQSSGQSSGSTSGSQGGGQQQASQH